MTPAIAFVDTPVLAYAVGDAHPHRQACRALLVAGREGRLEIHVSAEAVQEFLFHRLRRTDRLTAVRQARAVVAACTVHDFDARVVDQMMALIGETSVRGRDAVHAATAQLLGFTEIVTTDRHFDGVPGLTRRSPEEALAALP